MCVSGEKLPHILSLNDFIFEARAILLQRFELTQTVAGIMDSPRSSNVSATLSGSQAPHSFDSTPFVLLAAHCHEENTVPNLKGVTACVLLHPSLPILLTFASDL